MKDVKTVLLIVISATGMGFAGCDVVVSDHGHRDRGYAYMQAQPQYEQPPAQYVQPQPQYVIVQQAPPPLIVESRPPPPSGLYVWIDGSWNWNNQRYSWVAGRYALPPQKGAVWIAPRYERDTHGYRYTAGQWQNQHQDNGHDHN